MFYFFIEYEPNEFKKFEIEADTWLDFQQQILEAVNSYDNPITILAGKNFGALQCSINQENLSLWISKNWISFGLV